MSARDSFRPHVAIHGLSFRLRGRMETGESALLLSSAAHPPPSFTSLREVKTYFVPRARQRASLRFVR